MRCKKHTKACAFYVDSLLIKSFKKKRKREKENIPLLLCYLNMGENFVVINVQHKGFIVILHAYSLSPVRYPLSLDIKMLWDIYRIRDQE